MLKAKKSLGQNWMVNPHIVDRIVEAAQIIKEDIVLEIGPGTGNLTKKLAEKAGKVIAVEKDKRLIEVLGKEFENYRNIDVIEDDILKFNPETHGLKSGGYKIVANIPYYLTSNLIRISLEDWPKPKLMILTIQKEVAQRIVAKPPDMNLLALSVQYYSKPEIILNISKNNFRPVPKVDSAIIRLTPRDHDYSATALQTNKLFSLMKAGFSEKRKQLSGILTKALKLDKQTVIDALEKEGIDPKIRAENLSLDQWQKLAKIL